MSPRRRRRGTPLTAAVKARIEAMRAAVRTDARDVPGVYRMVSPDGEVIYVGKSKRLRTRLLSYFRASYPKDKGARILREAAALTWEPLPSEFAALLQELRLIKALRPRYNVAMKRDARYHAFVRVTGGTAPLLQVVRGAGDDDAGTYYGPFRGAIQLEEAIRELNDVLGLRDCAPTLPMRFADHATGDGTWPRTPGCIRHEIGKCLGPCIGAVREAEYLERFTTAQAFLEGREEAPLRPLRDRMEAASAALEYERAAVLRDKLQRLESLREQFGRLRFALESLTFTYTLPGAAPSDSRSYVIRRGRVRHEAPTPRTVAQRRAFAAAVADVVGSGDVAEPVRSARARTTPMTDGAATIRATSVNPPVMPTTVPGHEVDEVLLVAAWFKRHPGELERTVPLTP